MTTTNRAVLFFLILVGGAVSMTGQDLYSVETRPPRGFMPNVDQLSSPVDDIEPVSGKLHLQLPLASLPAGRGGSAFDLNLVYDAHLYDIFPTLLEPQPPYEYMGPMPAYELWSQGTAGGWHYNVENYKIDLEVRSDAAWDPNNCPANYSARIFRTRIGLADGSLHTMYLKGYETLPDNNATHDGFFGVDVTGRPGYCGNWPYLTGWQTYYSNDGSYLRFEILADASGLLTSQPWYLYFPDGRRLAGHGFKVEALYDANGNGIYFSSECYDPPPSGDCSLPYRTIHDDVGREIRIDYNVTDLPVNVSGRVDRVTTQGPNGQISWTVNWETLIIGQTPRTYYWSDAPWWPEYQLYLNANVVKYVQLPLAPAVDPGVETPPVWNSYAFGYSDDSDVGFGEVDFMRTPTGAAFSYRYVLEGGTGHWERIAEYNSVRERRIAVNGSPDLVWTYSGGFPYASFRQITGPDQAQTVYHFAIPNAYLENPSLPSQGVERLVYRIDEPNGRVTKRVWGQNRLPGFYWSFKSSNFYVKRETETIGNSAGSPTLTRVTEHTIDKNSNQLQNTEYDWVAYDPSGPEVGSVVKRVTQTVYYAEVPEASSTSDDPESYWNPQFNGLPRRLDAARRTEVRDGAGNIASLTEFEYDEPLGKGNPTATKRWDSVKSPTPPTLGNLSGSNSQVQRRSYGAYGNLEYIYDSPVTVNGPEIPTHISYESSGSFPNQVDYAYQTPEQRSWAYAWNVAAGTISSKTDLDNNVTTTYTYDNVGRQRFAIEANIRQTETLYDDPNMKVTVKKDLAAFGDGKLQVTSEYDQLGRVALVRTSEPGNTDGIKAKTSYYPTLNRTVVSSQYRTTADTTLEWTCTQMDASKRVTAVAVFKGSIEPTDCESTSNRTGITRTVYDTNWTRVTDPASKVRDEGRDALGQLVQVIENPSGLNYQTSYAYDTLGNLTHVNQGVQTRSFQYSSLSRLLSATNPESGMVTYAYADSGDLLSRTDARGIAATFTYDPMHRIKTKTYSDGTPSVTYMYYVSGAGSPKVGQLQSVSSAVAWSQNDSYDALGRVTSSSHTIAGDPATRNFVYSYWLNNGVRTVTNPSGRVIQYDLDDAGRIAKVYAGGTTYADLTVTSAPYTADGKLAQIKLGNNLWETRNYQTPGTPTLFKLGTVQGANDKLELEYNFSATANNGNLESHAIRQPGHTWTQTYGYDGVNRLTGASEPGGWSRTYGYDQYGNRWVDSTNGPPEEIHEPRYQTMFNPYTNRFTVESGITYDLAGNQTYFAPWTLGYDAENHNTTVTSASSGNGVYAYDGDGRRVKKTWTSSSGSTTTYYLYNALGQLAAEYSTGPSTAGTTYVHTDMLGSTRMVTNASGAAVECYDYLPFGRMLSDSVNARNTGCYPPNPDIQITSKLPQKFTGKVRDADTRLDFFGARYMSSAEGRFTSPDPYNLAFELSKAKSEKEKVSLRDRHIANPSVWNRYAYTLNNPLRFVDPTGECSKPIQDKDETGICIEAFIASKKIDKSRIGLGDNRKHSATDESLTAKSRVKVVVAPSGKIELEVESGRSSVFFNGVGLKGSTTAEIVQNKLNADGSRTIGLNMAGVNGEYGIGGPDGAIQGMFSFTISKFGVVSLNKENSAITEYPSWGIYSYETYGAKPRMLWESTERNIEALQRAPTPMTKIKP